MEVRDDNEYEDLLGLWSDLESGLGILLSSPASSQEFERRVLQYDRWMQTLLERDTDTGLYLLFQLASHSSVGYSASHALVTAVLCHLIGAEMALAAQERDALVRAALTMNIAMTSLQDQLAIQVERPDARQAEAIRSHSARGSDLLASLGIRDPLWLDTVARHHQEPDSRDELRRLTPVLRLSLILQVVDRYAAMISPRRAREARSATDSLRSILNGRSPPGDEVGHQLVKAVGLCPPGTFVRLDSEEIAVVMRRSSQPNRPFVAIVLDARGDRLNPPRLHRTAGGSPGIKSALSASAVQERLNHPLILQLGAHAARHG
ncbi:MAG: phosphodiesterase [Rhodoferax sp.]|nr:phosphodiesterase [Rhodoferax sp.]